MKQDRRKTKMTGRQVGKLVLILLLVAAVLITAVVLLRRRVSNRFGTDKIENILSAPVTQGRISTSVYGSGTLTDDDVEDVEIPDGVELKRIYVERGDTVQAGELLASVDTNTVLTAMAAVNDELEELDEEIAEAADETVDSTIRSAVSGRVKKIYAAEGDNVASVMYEKGALLVLSLDGYLAVDVECAELQAGDAVTVTDENGKAYPGEVSVMTGDVATVLVTDNGPLCDTVAEVSYGEGKLAGSGTLTIHEPLRIVGYAGTVSRLYIKENAKVNANANLIGLSDTAFTANYETLLLRRSEKEKELQTLIAIYKEGGIYATVSGTVKTVNAVEGEVSTEDSSTASAASADYSAGYSMDYAAFFGFGSSTAETVTESVETTAGTEQYFSICEDKTMSLTISVDETDILAVSPGQEAEVTVDAIENETFSGTVTEIDKAATSASGVTMYTATIRIDKTPAMLSGMSASATVSIDGVDNALIIPVDALNKTRAGYYVYTAYDEENDTLGGMVEVTVGVTNTDYAEITAGLTAADTVYYEKKNEFFFPFMNGMSGMGGMGGMGGRRG